ncbi:uncharacterized protein LOC121508871 [Cheilinus undulatus]|uniref:uncharacterized protein LOC121508871 n=1 Tax=Cheilinus undulatus TaxID=241271 RepID=UPI001BD4023F|nr:uncharacterized protein LOC121508871 [Cheilinus undulatus]
MMKINAYACLLFALSSVEMKSLNIEGRVGQDLTFRCSNWDVFFSIKENEKYLCVDPCSQRNHVITRAGFKKTSQNKRIELLNNGDVLYVTFTSLQKSDAGKYYCGAERTIKDAYIEVNLKVIDVPAQPSNTKAPSRTTTTVAVPSSPFTFSYGSDIFSSTSSANTTLSTTTPAASAAQQGRVSHLIAGVTVIITLLMLLLLLMRTMKKKKQKVVSRAHLPQEEVREEVEYDEIRDEDRQSLRQPEGLSTVFFSAEPDSVYANTSSLQDTEHVAQCDSDYSNSTALRAASSSVNPRQGCSGSKVSDHPCDVLYSVVQPPKKKVRPTGKVKLNQPQINDNDSFYSLVQLTGAT